MYGDYFESPHIIEKVLSTGSYFFPCFHYVLPKGQGLGGGPAPASFAVEIMNEWCVCVFHFKNIIGAITFSSQPLTSLIR
jgi:hypothetical protein